VYVANNLTDGPHQVVISNLGGGTQGTGAALDFDSAVVNSSTTPVLANTTGVNGTISTNVTSSGNASAASTSLTTAKPPSKGTNVGAIAGGVVGGVAALLILGGLLWFFFFRRKHQYKQARRDPVDLNGDANQPDHDGGEVEPFPNSRSGYGSTSPAANSNEYGSGPYANSSSENASSPGANQSSGREMSQHGPPILTAIPPPPASNATSYPRSPVTRSASGQQGYDDDRLSRTASNDSFRQRSSGPASSGSAPSTGLAPPISSSLPPNSSTTVKAADVALPFTARVPNAPPPRMNVRGREQDMGPIPFSEDGHGSDEGALPPDYQQATEPLPGQGPRPEDSL